jgi:hypothetical protein
MPETQTVTGTSFASFQDAVLQAFEQVPGNPAMEGVAQATVQRLWVEKGGFVGQVQFHAELVFDVLLEAGQ